MAFRIVTRYGQAAVFGSIYGPTQLFRFGETELGNFIGFYGQINNENNLIALGVIRDVCTASEWQDIRKT